MYSIYGKLAVPGFLMLTITYGAGQKYSRADTSKAALLARCLPFVCPWLLLLHTEQDSRWGDAEKKLLRRTKFSKVLEQKV